MLRRSRPMEAPWSAGGFARHHVRVPGDHAPASILQLPDIGEAAAGDRAIGRIGDRVIPHDNDNISVAADALDLNLERRVADTAGMEQGQYAPAFVHLLQRRVDEQTVGPEAIERGDIGGEEGHAGFFLELTDLAIPVRRAGRGCRIGHRDPLWRKSRVALAHWRTRLS